MHTHICNELYRVYMCVSMSIRKAERAEEKAKRWTGYQEQDDENG